MYTIESASLRPVSKHYREIILKQDLWANRIDKYMYKETKIRILMTRFFTDGSFASPYFKEFRPTLR